MVKYFLGLNDLKSSWDQVFAAFWQRYPNPYSKHVLTEDVIHREVTPDKVISRRLLTKTGIVPRWAERLFPTNVAHSAFILEDSVVDLKHKILTTFTWNINHSRLMECGLASFKSSINKTMKGFEYVLAGMQGETPTKTLRETAKETALAAKEKAKDLASKAGPQKKQHYV